jgi:predicted Zn-dependent protease
MSLRAELFHKTIFSISLVIFFSLAGPEIHAQVFPQVNTPAAQKQQQQQENQKLAIQYYDNQEYEKALPLFEALHREQPTQFHYTYYFLCLVALEDFSSAEKLVRDKMKDEQGPTRYDVDLGYLYLLMNKPDKATKQNEDILSRLKPTKANVMEIANAFTSRQQYDYAVKTYLRGRELLRNTDPFYLELARAYEVTGNYAGMIEEYLNMLEEDPSRLEMVQGRLQNALNRDFDDKISDLMREALLRRNQKNPDNRYFGEMLLWLSVQQKDFAFALIQARSLDTRFSENGMLVFNIGNLSLANQDYGVARDAYAYILNKGAINPYYAESLTGTLRARFLMITEGFGYAPKDLLNLEQEYKAALAELGSNPRTVYLMRDLAHLQAFYLNNLDEAMTLLEQAVAIPGLPEMVKAEIKLELGDTYLFTGEVWEASLLYSQVEKALKNEPIGHEAKFRNARLSYFIGEFEWAKAQLDVLKAATSKLIANDAMELSLLISDNMDPDSTYTALAFFARAELSMYRMQYDGALATLDSIRMLALSHPLDDDVLFRKAEIFISKNDLAQADSLLADIVEDYPFDILADNALFRRAELHAGPLNDKAAAMDMYQRLVLEYPGSLFATEARKRYRQLRGDFSNL